MQDMEEEASDSLTKFSANDYNETKRSINFMETELQNVFNWASVLLDRVLEIVVEYTIETDLGRQWCFTFCDEVSFGLVRSFESASLWL